MKAKLGGRPQGTEVPSRAPSPLDGDERAALHRDPLGTLLAGRYNLEQATDDLRYSPEENPEIIADCEETLGELNRLLDPVLEKLPKHLRARAELKAHLDWIDREHPELSPEKVMATAHALSLHVDDLDPELDGNTIDGANELFGILNP
jgi:hypothetical protein